MIANSRLKFQLDTFIFHTFRFTQVRAKIAENLEPSFEDKYTILILGSMYKYEVRFLRVRGSPKISAIVGPAHSIGKSKITNDLLIIVVHSVVFSSDRQCIEHERYSNNAAYMGVTTTLKNSVFRSEGRLKSTPLLASSVISGSLDCKN